MPLRKWDGPLNEAGKPKVRELMLRIAGVLIEGLPDPPVVMLAQYGVEVAELLGVQEGLTLMHLMRISGLAQDCPEYLTVIFPHELLPETISEATAEDAALIALQRVWDYLTLTRPIWPPENQPHLIPWFGQRTPAPITSPTARSPAST